MRLLLRFLLKGKGEIRLRCEMKKKKKEKKEKKQKYRLISVDHSFRFILKQLDFQFSFSSRESQLSCPSLVIPAFVEIWASSLLSIRLTNC